MGVDFSRRRVTKLEFRSAKNKQVTDKVGAIRKEYIGVVTAYVCPESWCSLTEELPTFSSSSVLSALVLS